MKSYKDSVKSYKDSPTSYKDFPKDVIMNAPEGLCGYMTIVVHLLLPTFTLSTKRMDFV